MPSQSKAAPPRVVAVLVVHDGEAWLPGVLTTLARQDYPNLDLVVVDNASTDGSTEILRRRVPESRRMRLRRRVGFGRAVHAAMRHEAVGEAELVLLVHDDLVLAPDAVSRMAAALTADDTLAAVGPKLREWEDEPVLQQVGMTIDRLGRAESGLEERELDQGQADQSRDVLYVSTAGMLLRAEVFRELRGFDARLPAMRDDLDYCWRAWLAGWRVAVVPEAVGYHVAAATRGVRPLVRRRPWQARYYAERHALATVLKCYGLRTLLWVIPALTLLGVAKVGAFLLTRRFGPAVATVHAYLWNAAMLPRTLRLRRGVQRARVRSDAELRPLMAQGLPRLQAYGDVVREWFVADDTPALLRDESVPVGPGAPAPGGLGRWVNAHPIGAAAIVLGVLYLLGTLPLLGGGQLVGGQVLPWPEDPWRMLQSYVGGGAGEPLASGVAPAPIQAVLGAVGLAGLGNLWVAQRLVVLGLLPLAWVGALRAGRLITARKAPRALGATLYVLSPPVIGTVAQGRLGDAVVAALLPAVILLTARAAGPRSRRDQAWRAVGLLALASTTAIAASPGAGLAVAAVLAAGLVVAVWPGVRRHGLPAVRMLTAVAGTAALLAPWAVGLLTTTRAGLEAAPHLELPAWRALLLVPDVVPGVAGAAGVLTMLLVGAIVALALLLGLGLRPLPVVALIGGLVASAAVAWALARVGPAWVWPPALLLGGALAVAGLAVVAARTAVPALAARRFGLAQVGVVVGAAVLLVGLVTGAGRLAAAPWEQLEREPELLPAFVTGDGERVGAYRVLLVDADDDALRWTVLADDGPSLVTFGTVASPELVAHVDAALADVARGHPDAGAALGRANIRYVVLSDEARDVLDDALLAQPDLEPLPAGGGGVLQARSWLPRAAVIADEGLAEAALAPGSPGDLTAVEESGLGEESLGAFQGAPGRDAVLTIAEAPGHQAVLTRRVDPVPRPVEADAPLEAYDLSADAGLVTVRPEGRPQRLAEAGLEALVALGMLSLVLRPPRFTQEARARPRATLTELDVGASPSAGDGEAAGAATGAGAGAGPASGEGGGVASAPASDPAAPSGGEGEPAPPAPASDPTAPPGGEDDAPAASPDAPRPDEGEGHDAERGQRS